ncbi:MAG: hypothetical protein ABIQ10_14500 [Gemmatimonadaceae bacterium]
MMVKTHVASGRRVVPTLEYSNHLFDTSVDGIFKAREWSAPRVT